MNKIKDEFLLIVKSPKTDLKIYIVMRVKIKQYLSFITNRRVLKLILLFKIKIFLKNKLSDFWYWLMSPLAYFFTSEKENKRYEKKKSKITEEQAIKWIAQDIARYLIRYRSSSIDILICDYASDDDFWNDCYLNGPHPYYLKRKKTRMAFYKFKKTIEFQEEVVNRIKCDKNVRVVEKVEDFKTWKRIDNYQKTVSIYHASKRR